MKWLPVPRLGDSRLMLAAAVSLLLSVPLSFWGLLESWPAAQALRDLVLPAAEKSDLHILRVLHFLALAYMALSLVEPRRDRLDRGIGHLFVLIGRQSLACFLAGVVLARLLGVVADTAGHDALIVALLNITGFGLILATAVIVGWFKSSPWRAPSGSAVRAEPARTSSDEGLACPALPTRVREAS